MNAGEGIYQPAETPQSDAWERAEAWEGDYRRAVGDDLMHRFFAEAIDLRDPEDDRPAITSPEELARRGCSLSPRELEEAVDGWRDDIRYFVAELVWQDHLGWRRFWAGVALGVAAGLALAWLEGWAR